MTRRSVSPRIIVLKADMRDMRGDCKGATGARPMIVHGGRELLDFGALRTDLPWLVCASSPCWLRQPHRDPSDLVPGRRPDPCQREQEPMTPEGTGPSALARELEGGSRRPSEGGDETEILRRLEARCACTGRLKIGRAGQPWRALRRAFGAACPSTNCCKPDGAAGPNGAGGRSRCQQSASDRAV